MKVDSSDGWISKELAGEGTTPMCFHGPAAGRLE